MPIAVWAPKAESDLEEILFYIRVTADRPLTARRIGEEIVAAVEEQAALPTPGSRHLAAPPEWRYLRHKRWIIFFQPHAKGLRSCALSTALATCRGHSLIHPTKGTTDDH